MVFSSINFLFLFLPALLVFYFLVPAKNLSIRNVILLLFSLFFYGYSGPSFLLLMLVSIGINYSFGLLTERAQEKKIKKRAVILAAFANLVLLSYFKYFMFLVENMNAIFRTNLPIPKIILPIGISFFTFQGLSYVLDIYNGDAQAKKNPLDVALYISLFPQLIAGPIVRYNTIAAEIGKRSVSYEDFYNGLCRFCFGLSKKVLLSNSVGFIADEIYKFPALSMSTATAWVGAIAYTLQIYFDFSGYSDMALGLGHMFGFHFWENFNYPYIARSVTDFWRRWHISLSTWFRDYVYIPLGGNRGGTRSHIRNIFIVWLLTGIWHGAAWNFILWGIYYAIWLLLEKFVYGKALASAWRPLQHMYALLIVIIGWVFFRAPDIGYALSMLQSMFGFGEGGIFDSAALYYVWQYKVEFAIALIACLPIKNLVPDKKDRSFIWEGLQGIYCFSLFGLCVLYLVNSTFNPFIYFRF